MTVDTTQLPVPAAEARPRIPPPRPRPAWADRAETYAGYAPLALIVLAGMVLAWSRFMMLSQGLWGDEAFSVMGYISHGPSGIWDAARWLPNDHLLFEALTWLTSSILSSHTSQVYRIWGVMPAIGAAVLICWWLWARGDRWAAAIFAVLSTVAPLFFDLGTMARGYGLGFLAASMVLVGAECYLRTERRWALLLFAFGGFVGIAALENFVAVFVVTGLVLMVRPHLRRPVGIAIVVVGVATIAWYGPVLSKSISYRDPAGLPLPWYGFVQAPLRDLFGVGINELAPSVSVTAGAIIAAVVLAAGTVASWLRRDRMLVMLVLLPTAATYLLVEVTGEHYQLRFGSFVILPLIALGAIGIARLTSLPRTVPGLRLAAVALLGVLSLIVVGHFADYAANYAQTPLDPASTIGEMIKGVETTGAPVPVVTNEGQGTVFYYSRPYSPRLLPAARLARVFCADPRSFIYVQVQWSISRPPTTCLTNRGAFAVPLAGLLGSRTVWFVPAMRVSRTAAAG